MQLRKQKASSKNRKPFYREALSALFWALAISLVLRATVVQAYHVPSGSMEPNMLVGDQFLVSKAHYGSGCRFPAR